MSNPRELHDARRRAAHATALLASIEALPRRVGQSVRWRNGVIWTRAGDDDWRPDSDPKWRYPSDHVASFWWVPVKKVLSGE